MEVRDDGGSGVFWRRPAGKRGAFLLARLLAVGQSGVRVRPLGGDRANAVRLHRFLHNPQVTPHERVATARAHTKSRIAGRHVLAIQDTTSLRDDGQKLSLQLHPTIAVDAADGALLGLVDAVFLHHDGAAKPHRHDRPFDVKESRRWLDATCQAGELLAAGVRRMSMRRSPAARPGSIC